MTICTCEPFPFRLMLQNVSFHPSDAHLRKAEAGLVAFVERNPVAVGDAVTTPRSLPRYQFDERMRSACFDTNPAREVNEFSGPDAIERVVTFAEMALTVRLPDLSDLIRHGTRR
jgi:hypothetical protein